MKTLTLVFVLGLAMFTASSGNPAVDAGRVMYGASAVARMFVSEDKAQVVGDIAALVAFPFAIQSAALKAWARNQYNPD